jgi:hypothetical protein
MPSAIWPSLLEVRGTSEAIDDLGWDREWRCLCRLDSSRTFVGVLTAVNVLALAVCPAINSDLRPRYGCACKSWIHGAKSRRIVVPMRM